MAPAEAKVLEAPPVGAGEAADEGLDPALLPVPAVAALVGEPAVELAADSTESVAVLTASVEAAGTVLRGHDGLALSTTAQGGSGLKRHSRSTVLDSEEVGSDKRAETALSHVAGKVPRPSCGACRAEVGWRGERARLLKEEPRVSVRAGAGQRTGACDRACIRGERSFSSGQYRSHQAKAATHQRSS